MKTVFTAILLLFCYLKPSAQTLHAIFVTDVSNQKFSVISQTDENIMKGFCMAVSQALSYKIDTISLQNTKFNSTAIKESLKNIKTTPEDIIVFFYSGHGLASKKSAFPILKLSNLQKEAFLFDDIALLIKSKNVRFGLLMGDFIEKFSTQKNTSYNSIFEFRDSTVFNRAYSRELTQKLILQKLFLEPCGILTIASFKKGSASYTLPGYNVSTLIFQFSNILIKLLINSNENIKTVSWESMIDDIKENSDSKLKAFIPENKSQALAWEMKNCDDELKNKITQWNYPMQSFPTDNELSTLLNSLANETNENNQKDLISKLKNICVDSTIVYTEVRLKNISKNW